MNGSKYFVELTVMILWDLHGSRQK